MALLYLDTSALVKLYITERGSERMVELASSDANSMATCAITQVEFHSAVDRRRRLRGGDVGEEAAERAVERFNRHFKSEVFRHAVDDQRRLTSPASWFRDTHCARMTLFSSPPA